jgi:hypothetical protein
MDSSFAPVPQGYAQLICDRRTPYTLVFGRVDSQGEGWNMANDKPRIVRLRESEKNPRPSVPPPPPPAAPPSPPQAPDQQGSAPTKKP